MKNWTVRTHVCVTITGCTEASEMTTLTNVTYSASSSDERTACISIGLIAMCNYEHHCLLIMQIFRSTDNYDLLKEDIHLTCYRFCSTSVGPLYFLTPFNYFVSLWSQDSVLKRKIVNSPFTLSLTVNACAFLSNSL